MDGGEEGSKRTDKKERKECKGSGRRGGAPAGTLAKKEIKLVTCDKKFDRKQRGRERLQGDATLLPKKNE